jgi:hypothetical protein
MNAIFLEDVLKRQRETTEDVQKLDDRMQMAETNAETAKNNVQFFLKTRMLKDLGIVFFSTLFGYLINKATQN